MRRVLIVALCLCLAATRAFPAQVIIGPPDTLRIALPENGATVSGAFTVKAAGYAVQGGPPRASLTSTMWRVHLYVDAPYEPQEGKLILEDEKHIDFGPLQASKEVTLLPGPHTLQLVITDANNLLHTPAIVSEPVSITVKKPSRRK